MAEIVSMKILSIIPAAPGWKAEFLSEKTAEYAVPVMDSGEQRMGGQE